MHSSMKTKPVPVDLNGGNQSQAAEDALRVRRVSAHGPDGFTLRTCATKRGDLGSFA